jgi:hypothetical protein
MTLCDKMLITIGLEDDTWDIRSGEDAIIDVTRFGDVCV